MTAGLQRAVSVHAQLGALASWPRRSSTRSAGASSTPTRRARTRRAARCRGDRQAARRSATTSPAALQVVERVHRARRAAHGFRHHALRHAAGPGLPGLRRQAGHRPPGRCPTRRSSRARRSSAPRMLNELYGMIRRRLEIFANLPFASLDRMALKKRLDELGRQPPGAGLTEDADEGRHQRHGPHRPAGAARRDGRRASRRRTIRARDNRLDVVHVNEIKGGAAATAHLLEFDSIHGRWRSAFGVDGERAHPHRRQVASASAPAPRRATSPGAISAATSCWNAPASS